MKTMVALFAVVVLGSAGDVTASEVVQRGVVVSGGPEHGSVLLRTADGLSLVAMDPAAMRSPEGRGAPGPLAPGDRVRYRVTLWGGMKIVDFLEVMPRTAAELSK